MSSWLFVSGLLTILLASGRRLAHDGAIDQFSFDISLVTSMLALWFILIYSIAE